MKKLLIVFFLIFSCSWLYAQENSLKDVPTFNHQRFYLGGTGGLSFGDVTDVEISPLVGYRVTDRLSIGIQPSYTFLKEKLYDINGNYVTNYQTYYLGCGAYGRYYILNNVFLHVQYELNNYEALVANNPVYPTDFYFKRVTIPSLLLGGGYRQPISEKAGFTISILYDVLQNRLSPYAGDPFIIRMGFNFGL